MQSIPDGGEVVQTADEARALASPPLLIVDNLTRYLDEHGFGSGPLSWERIGDGQSNVTYRIEREDESMVLRRGPRPPLPRSTHNMEREARIQRLVAKAGVPVPKVLAVCRDAAVIGGDFYLMGFLEGTVMTNAIPTFANTLDERWSTSAAAVDELVKLHQVDVSSGEIARLGRPEGYLKRQADLFSSLWHVNSNRELPLVAEIAAWLLANLPESQASSVVHGDYRLGNLMFAPDAPARVSAILDWEMATLGDPLADLGYLTATYPEPGSFPTPLDLTPVTREPGFMTRVDLIARYGAQMPLDLSALPWYQTLALWKGAIFCEAIYTRWRNGERPGDDGFGPSLELGVPALLDGASRFAGLTSAAR